MSDDNDWVTDSAAYWLWPKERRDKKHEDLAFCGEARQEMLRLIVDVQQNRNRPEEGE